MVSTSSPDQSKSHLPQIHTTIHNIRTACLVALGTQLGALYMDFASVNKATFFTLFALILANAYLVFIRWYHKIEERRDVQDLLNPRGDLPHKFLYALALFGGFGVSMAIHMMSPALPTGMFALLYNLANYVSILGSIVCPFLEIYEGVHERNAHKRRG